MASAQPKPDFERLWGREDSNLRRLSRRVYSPFPLAARAHPQGADHCSLVAAAGFARRGAQAFAEKDPMESRHGAGGAGLSIVEDVPFGRSGTPPDRQL